MLRDFFNKMIGKLVGLSQKTGGQVSGERKVNPKISEMARIVAGESAILLKNDGTLPIKEGDVISVFGRSQLDWFYAGYGSGGDVKYPYSINLIDGIKNVGTVKLNEELLSVYEDWTKLNRPYDGYWGHWPMHYDEMKLTDSLVENASKKSNTAIVVIARSAGEDREQLLEKGSFYLTDDEIEMLNIVTKHFNKVVVVINAGNIIDYSWIEDYKDKISAVLLAWQGGMESGNAIADLLSGKISPSGKLIDTVARNYKDYPSSKDFGNGEYNNYVEDIYVGYRYFETFDKDSVLFPFGYGLSYTKFDCMNSRLNSNKDLSIELDVKNVGTCEGKEVIQVYVEAPQGKLGKALRSLVAFKKTKSLKPNEVEKIKIDIAKEDLLSYDDSGITGYPNSFIAEIGIYKFYVGENVRDAVEVGSFTLNKEIVKTAAIACPVDNKKVFKIIKPIIKDGSVEKSFQKVSCNIQNLGEKITNNLPTEIIPEDSSKKITFNMVKKGEASIDEFISHLTIEELEVLSRGDLRMDSKYGASGNAGAFGGICESLREKGVPAAITTDGPSGIRLLSYASLLPCGSALASSFNVDIVEKLYELLGYEMKEKGSDILLGPGMNIHRNPLCGRNFEYYSEDPLVSGHMAAAVVKGIQKTGVAACPKHFACNHQEKFRVLNDSRVSERALREIYLKNFEICIKESNPFVIMTSYNKINGIYNYYNYDLVTTILRNDWKYEGVVITDWWTKGESDPNFDNVTDSAYRIRAQVDVVMPGGSRINGKYKETAKKSFEKSGLTLSEMQRVAKNVLTFLLKCKATNDKIK